MKEATDITTIWVLMVILALSLITLIILDDELNGLGPPTIVSELIITPSHENAILADCRNIMVGEDGYLSCNNDIIIETIEWSR